MILCGSELKKKLDKLFSDYAKWRASHSNEYVRAYYKLQHEKRISPPKLP